MYDAFLKMLIDMVYQDIAGNIPLVQKGIAGD